MLNNLIDRIKLPFRKDRELISSLYEILGVYPHNMAFYKQALMHKSIGHRETGKKGHLGRKINNERLEFLGDAILDAVVGDIVYKNYPGKPEGFLTNTRSKLVQRETLGKLAQQIGLSKLILSSGRTASHNSYMGGNAFEALVGALYLDRGYEACYKFWEERILGRYLNIDKMAYKEVNFKSKLIEWAQKNRIQIEFRLEDQSKDQNGSPTFKYTVVLETIDGGTGSGFSKKESQQHACEKTLKLLKGDKKYTDSIFAAKAERTKMDEDMIVSVPTVEPAEEPNAQHGEAYAEHNAPKAKSAEHKPAEHDELQSQLDELHIGASSADAGAAGQSREDIIAAAEAAAYEEKTEPVRYVMQSEGTENK